MSSFALIEKFSTSKHLNVSPEKNHWFWVVTLMSQMGDMCETTTETCDNEGCKCSDIRQAVLMHAKFKLCGVLCYDTAQFRHWYRLGYLGLQLQLFVQLTLCNVEWFFQVNVYVWKVSIWQTGLIWWTEEMMQTVSDLRRYLLWKWINESRLFSSAEKYVVIESTSDLKLEFPNGLFLENWN